jgi:hypothetical protein
LNSKPNAPFFEFALAGLIIGDFGLTFRLCSNSREQPRAPQTFINGQRGYNP